MAVGMSGTASANRLALVVANETYSRAPSVSHASADAAEVATALQAVGFKLVGDSVQRNVTRAQLYRHLRTLADASENGEAALFYYVGHAVAGTDDNYLLTSDDADIQHIDDLSVSAVSVNSVKRRLDSASGRMSILILDACRDSPLPTGLRSAGLGRGLARVSAPAGGFIAYSASPGQVARTDARGRSLFASALVAQLTEPGMRIDDLFGAVSRRVREQTDGAQVPWRLSSLEQPFYFRPGGAEVAMAPGASAEMAFWDTVKTSGRRDLVEAYLGRYPAGQFADAARSLLDELPTGGDRYSLDTDSLEPLPDLAAAFLALQAEQEAAGRPKPPIDIPSEFGLNLSVEVSLAQRSLAKCRDCTSDCSAITRWQLNQALKDMHRAAAPFSEAGQCYDLAFMQVAINARRAIGGSCSALADTEASMMRSQFDPQYAILTSGCRDYLARGRRK